MATFYEGYRSGKDGFEMRRNGEYSYGPHFHQNVEMLVMKNGRCELTVDGKELALSSGQVAFIDSFCVHSYGRNFGDDHCLLIIPYAYLSEFNRARGNGVLSSPIIDDKNMTDKIMTIIDCFLSEARGGYELFSAVNAVLGLVYRYGEFREAEGDREYDLIRQILSYIDDNFTGDISLKGLSKDLGYAEGHISRVFHKFVKRSFPGYVNDKRLEYLEKIDDGKQKITRLIYEVGFKSVQSYYRAKRDRLVSRENI